MEKRLIVNVGRELGSGGRRMAQILGELLDLKFYDKELIHEASQRSGICQDCFEQVDEQPQKVWHSRFPILGDLGFNGLNGGSLFEIHYKTVQRLAQDDNCVFVGRCTDYILRDNPACFNIFVCAPLDFRVARLCRDNRMTEKEAEQLIAKTDKSRAAYYNFYTDKIWGKASSYHLCIDTSLMGVEDSAGWVAEFIRKVRL